MRKNELDEVVDRRITELEKFAIESDEYTAGVSNLQTFVGIRNSIREESTADIYKVFDKCLDAAKIVVPFVFYAYFTGAMINFELVGTPTTSVFRNFTRFIRPDKL